MENLEILDEEITYWRAGASLVASLEGIQSMMRE